MFSKTITNSSRFLMMPQSSQNLYFHLGMNADDDGFCEHFTIMRMTESKPDDLKILQAKNFIHVFDDRVLVITDWKENNYLRSDRYTPSKYLKIYKQDIKLLSENHGIPDGIPDVNKMDTQIRLDKVSKDKIREDKTITRFAPPSETDVSLYLKERNITTFTAQRFIDHYQARGWMIGKNKMKDWKAAVRTWEGNNKESAIPKRSNLIDLSTTPIEP
jgi:hypothetical protein